MTFHPGVLPRLALLVPVLLTVSTTAGDPDLWGHVAFGRDIIAARAIPPLDGYSFTSDRPWVNHEWLAEVVFALAYGLGGAPGLILLRLTLLFVTFGLVARVLGRTVATPLVRDLLLVFALAGTYAIAQTVRPQLFSLVAFAWLLWCVSEYQRRGWRALWSVPLVMGLWANAHGGWLVGLGAFGVWTTVTVASGSGMPPARTPARREHLAALAIVLVAAACATLVNPYGAGLWRFLAETVSFTRADITEWQPLFTTPALRIALWMAAAALAVSAAIAGRPGAPALAVVALLGYASFRVRRIDGFFILSAVMLCGPAFTYARARVAAATAARAPHPGWSARAPARAALAAVIAVVILADGVARPEGRFGCIDTSDRRLPDPDAGAWLRSAAPVEGRMLTWFDWGEYAIWHLAPRVRVSMDGRRETVYSAGLVQAHLDFYFDRDGLALVDRLRPDSIWLPASLPVVPRLEAAGWQRTFGGDRSIVLQRPGGTSEPARPGRTAPAAQCFPGP